jgi:muramoyltetrapeptide carboxypeptidase
MIKPPALKKGDTIGIISPASSEIPEKFEQAQKRLQKFEFRVVEGGHSRKKYRYFAGSDEERAEDFNNFIKNDAISAIFASRGGYGCSRILPLIDYDAIKEHPKIILGGSDITALLWAIRQKTGLITFFGPMALQIGAGLEEFSEQWLWRTLCGEIRGKYKLPTASQLWGIGYGRVQGRLIGGCLSLVVSLLGTEYFGDLTGTILFLEEIGEQPYRLDRMLTHLRNAGAFDRISGLLLGDFHKCWDEDVENSLTLKEIIEQVLGKRKIPVLAGLPFGHGEKKMTLPLGVEVEMDVEMGELRFLEEGVMK